MANFIWPIGDSIDKSTIWQGREIMECKNDIKP